MQYTADNKIAPVVRYWLIAGLVMIFFQIVIGGITRLTGSGLSITKWQIVTGALPPLSAADWQHEFDLYQATPQYQKINQGMSLESFKFIYFWEYFHRLWARLMFFVFVIPFAWFCYRGMLSRRLVPRLLIMVALAGLEGFFGWIMVASGLIQRPWVNAYNLTLHLCMALIIFSHLLWTTFIAYQPKRYVLPALMSWPKWLFGLAFFQIALGALMSGTKAGLLYPTWPDMQGGYLPVLLTDASYWHLENFTRYDSNPFFPTLIQFLHRNTAYLLSLLCLYFAWQNRRIIPLYPALRLLLGLLTLQVLLGIFTLINCKGHIPVLLGVLHQAGAVLLLSAVLWTAYKVGEDAGAAS
jgi:heme a synthase